MPFILGLLIPQKCLSGLESRVKRPSCATCRLDDFSMDSSRQPCLCLTGEWDPECCYFRSFPLVWPWQSMAALSSQCVTSTLVLLNSTLEYHMSWCKWSCTFYFNSQWLNTSIDLWLSSLPSLLIFLKIIILCRFHCTQSHYLWIDMIQFAPVQSHISHYFFCSLHCYNP